MKEERIVLFRLFFFDRLLTLAHFFRPVITRIFPRIDKGKTEEHFRIDHFARFSPFFKKEFQCIDKIIIGVNLCNTDF